MSDMKIGESSSYVSSAHTEGKPAHKPDEKEIAHPQPRDSAEIKVSILPQDPLVSKPEVISVPKSDVGKDLKGARVVTDDAGFPKAIADTDGNYFYDVGTPQFDQVNAHITTSRTLGFYQSLLGREIPWAFGDKIISVFPHKEEGANAYYSREEGSLNFFYFDAKGLGKMVQTSESEDVVSHESGHAILDGLRPDYIESYDTETMSFHEAFGDVTAMLMTMRDEENLKQVVVQTGGDLKKPNLLSSLKNRILRKQDSKVDLTKPNLISNLAEEFGRAIHLDDSNPANDQQDYLRTAINNYTYTDPSQLPDSPSGDGLSNEVHSFSKLFTGAFYDVLTAACDKQNDKQNAYSKDNLAALKTAGDDLSKIWGKTLEFLPVSSVRYRDAARAMLKADAALGGKYQDEIKSVFVNRKILAKGEPFKMELLKPGVTLNKTIETKEEALEFLKGSMAKFRLPGGFEPSDVEFHKNNEKEQYLNYEYAAKVPVTSEKGGKFEGYNFEVKGGLALGFNKDGKMLNYHFDPINEEKTASSQAWLENAIRKGQVYEAKGQGEPKFGEIPDISRYKAVAYTDAQGNKLIRRIPVIDL
ncbi:MAG: hypothetical protein V2A78_08985 [bacterium]